MKKKQQQDSAYSNSRIPLMICALGLFLTCAQPAAANWRVAPQLGVGAEYDSNSRLQADNVDQSVNGYGLSAQATFIYDSPLSDFELTPRLRSKKYSSNSQLDSNDQFLRLNFNHRRQLASFRVRGNYSRESVRTAERSDVDFDIENPDEIPGDDSARVLDVGKRARILLVPEFNYKFTERFSARARVNYLDVSYDDTDSTQLNDFTDTGVEGSVGYGWTQKDTVSLGAYTRKYEPGMGGRDFSGSGFTLGYGRDLSQRTRLDMSVGSDTTEDRNGQDKTNPVGSISIVHRLQTTRIVSAFRRSVNGGGGGELSLRNAVSVNISRDVTEKLTISGGARIYRTEALDDNVVGFDERDYVQLRALLRLRVSRTISVDFDYRHTRIDRELAVTDADSNRFNLWVHWHPGQPAR